MSACILLVCYIIYASPLQSNFINFNYLLQGGLIPNDIVKSLGEEKKIRKKNTSLKVCLIYILF